MEELVAAGHLVPISRAVLQSTWGRIFTADRQRVAAGGRGGGLQGEQRTKLSISCSWVCFCIFSAADCEGGQG
eukprot:COSAG06_NODE_41286_length_393_cov_0.581633_1_plen_72_part_10